MRSRTGRAKGRRMRRREHTSLSENVDEQKSSYTSGIFSYEYSRELFSKLDNNLAFSCKNEENLRDSCKQTQKDIHWDAHRNIDVITSNWKQSKCPKID